MSGTTYETTRKKTSPPLPFYDRIMRILEAARSGISRTVNTTQVVANWLIGREIVEYEQHGKRRAEYGEGLLRELAARLGKEYGVGYDLSNLKSFKQFYLTYPSLAGGQKGHAMRGLFLKDVQPS